MEQFKKDLVTSRNPTKDSQGKHTAMGERKDRGENAIHSHDPNDSKEPRDSPYLILLVSYGFAGLKY